MQQHLGSFGNHGRWGMSRSDADRPDGVPDRSTGRLKVVGGVSATITVLAVVALGVMTLGSAHTITAQTTVTGQVDAAARIQLSPTISASPASVPGSAGATSDHVGSSGLPVTVPDSTGTVVSAPVANTTDTSTSASDTSPGSVSTSPSKSGVNSTAAAPACPLALPVPAQAGGLASLIGLAPLLGPFTAEAFAPAAAYQPVLQVLGPLLVEFAKEYAVAEPSLTPLINQIKSLENQGFTVLSPLYGPYRTYVLSLETALATALAPFAQLAASNPASSCLVDVEGILTSAIGS